MGIFVTRDRPFSFPVKCKMANFPLVNRDFHSLVAVKVVLKKYFP